MEKEARNQYRTRGTARSNGGSAAERELLLRWGNRKRLRCVKVRRRNIQVAATATAEKAAANQRRAAAVLRNSDDTETMRSSAQQQQQQNNVIHMIASPDRELAMRGGNSNGNLPAPQDNEKGSLSGNEGSMWPKFAVALTNKEKVEDFLMFKGSRPSHRPKKRAKAIQKTINLVCPGTWLCDLTLGRYEVREKKILKTAQYDARMSDASIAALLQELAEPGEECW